MITAVMFVLAAGCGAGLRGLLGTSPWRTAALNIVGSFALGLLANWTGPALTVLGVGAIGSFTTFSTFVAHWVEEVDETSISASNPRSAVALVVVSITGGIVAAYSGIELAGL